VNTRGISFFFGKLRVYGVKGLETLNLAGDLGEYKGDEVFLES